MSNTKVSRRDFVKGSAMAATIAGISMPFNILQAGVSPNEQLHLAHIGLGGRASHLAGKLIPNAAKDTYKSVAFCDPYTETWKTVAGHCKEPAENLRKNYTHVPWFLDYRKMYDKMGKDIDAVVVNGVTQMHYPAIMWSLNENKHVFGQKPLCIKIDECHNIRNKILEKNRVTGWDTSNPGGPETYKDFMDSGVIGDVKELHIAFRGGHSVAFYPTKGFKTSPKNVNWDLWTGVSPKREYYPGMHYQGWMNTYSLGIGGIGNQFMPHSLNNHAVVQKLDNPISVTMIDSFRAPINYPTWSFKVMIEFAANEFRPALKLFAYGTGYSKEEQDFIRRVKPTFDLEEERKAKLKMSSFIVGSKSNAMCGYGGGSIRLIPESKMQNVVSEVSKTKGKNTWFGKEEKLNRYTQFIEACKQSKIHGSSSNLVDMGCYCQQTMLLTYYAMLRNEKGKKLLWDNKNCRFTNDDEADKFARREYRPGWNV